LMVANHDLRMYGVQYSPLGDLLATQHMDGSIWIWDARERRVLRRIASLGGFTYGSLSFSPDGLYIATGAASGALHVRDALTGELVWQNHVHRKYVYTTCFGRDSHTLVSGGDDGLCFLWDLHDLVNALNARRSQNGLLSTDELWQALSQDRSVAAYQALADLSIMPAAAAELIGEKLGSVEMLLDPDLMEEGTPAEEAGRTGALKRRLIAEDLSVEHVRTARRALALLRSLRTPAARKVLEELAAGDPDGDLGKMAAAMLARWD
jgi:hypothetical protein